MGLAQPGPPRCTIPMAPSVVQIRARTSRFLENWPLRAWTRTRIGPIGMMCRGGSARPNPKPPQHSRAQRCWAARKSRPRNRPWFRLVIFLGCALSTFRCSPSAAVACHTPTAAAAPARATSALPPAPIPTPPPARGPLAARPTATWHTRATLRLKRWPRHALVAGQWLEQRRGVGGLRRRRKALALLPRPTPRRCRLSAAAGGPPAPLPCRVSAIGRLPATDLASLAALAPAPANQMPSAATESHCAPTRSKRLRRRRLGNQPPASRRRRASTIRGRHPPDVAPLPPPGQPTTSRRGQVATAGRLPPTRRDRPAVRRRLPPTTCLAPLKAPPPQRAVVILLRLRRRPTHCRAPPQGLHHGAAACCNSRRLRSAAAAGRQPASRRCHRFAAQRPAIARGSAGAAGRPTAACRRRVSTIAASAGQPTRA